LIVSEKEMRRVKMTGLHWHMTHTKFHKNPSIGFGCETYGQI